MYKLAQMRNVNEVYKQLIPGAEPYFDFLGFAISECTVEIDQQSAKYLRAVHRTALELAVHNRFGADIGGFWLLPAHITQLRQLPDCYPANEAHLVLRAINAYLIAQIGEIYTLTSRDQLDVPSS
jgi:hypothetical protein